VILRDTIYRVTIQTVSFAADALMLLTAVAVVVLVVAAVTQLARRRARSAAVAVAAAGALVAAYSAALIVVGLASAPQQLRPADAKCFDDWCAIMVGARQEAPGGTVIVDVQLQNRGRGRAMRADLSRAYLEVPGKGEVGPVDGRAMQTMLQPGQHVDVELTFRGVESAPGVRFVVSEGTSGVNPGLFEIGGEGSPFHSKAGWPL
jgi:hypothetical protein